MADNLLALRIVNITRVIHRVAKVTPIPVGIAASDNLWPFIEKLLDVCAGLLAVYVIKAKWSQTKNKDNQTMKLVRAVQERDKAITRLETEISGWKLQHGNLTSNQHLH